MNILKKNRLMQIAIALVCITLGGFVLLSQERQEEITKSLGNDTISEVKALKDKNKSSSYTEEEQVKNRVRREDERLDLDERKGFFVGFSKKMPEFHVFNKDEAVEKLQFIHRQEPMGDVFASYKLFIPKGWVTVSDDKLLGVKKGDKIYGRIATYISDRNAVSPSQITIDTYELTNSVSAKNWVVSYMIDYGYILEGLKEEDWYAVDFLATVFHSEGSLRGDYVEYARALINGNRIFLLTYSIPVERWDQEKVYQVSSAKSFQLLEVDNARRPEMVSYDITGYVDFMYPRDWRLGQLNQNDFDRPRVRLINLDTVRNKMIEQSISKNSRQYSNAIVHAEVVLYSNTSTSLVDELERHKELIEKMGFDIKKKLNHNIKMVFPKVTDINKLEIYTAENKLLKGDGYEVWIAYMKNHEAYFIFSMVTPSKDARYYTWLENKAAFERIVSSVEPVSFYEE